MIKSYGEVIRETLDKALEKDKSVFLIGEDIGVYGGAFGITKGLLEKYGQQRVINSPMSEQAILGFATGSAMRGMKPVLEIMFMDFVTLIYDQLLNHASTFTYLSNGKINIPLVIRVPAGGGRGYGATHSKTLIAPLMHIPGIKIVAPSNASEAKGLLNSALKDKNPVVFIEHKLLYATKEDVKNAPEFIPLGKGKIVRKGKDVLVITFSKMVKDCLEVAEKLEQEGEGISAEILDLRTVKPLDIDLIQKSTEKIGKVIVVEEGYATCGVASEIIAQINDKFFFSLDAPVKRVSTLDVPIACCPSLEKEIIPSKERIEKGIRELLNE